MIDFLQEGFDSIMKMFNSYYGDFKYFTLFIFAILINFALIKKEDRKDRRIVSYLPLVILLILFNPVVYMKTKDFADRGRVYWRFFWLVPLAPTLAYAIVKLVYSKEEKFQKVFIAILALLVIGFSGKYIYTKENFQKVNNVYKCSDDVLDVIKLISNQDISNKKAMIPIPVVPWVRQYDANIAIEYDRSPSGVYNDRWINEYEQGIVSKNMQKFLDDGCNFFVCYNYVTYDVNFEEYGFDPIGENVNYIVYMLAE